MVFLIKFDADLNRERIKKIKWINLWLDYQIAHKSLWDSASPSFGKEAKIKEANFYGNSFSRG